MGTASMTRHTTYDPDADAVSVRDTASAGDGFFSAELPISSDTVARDQAEFSEQRLRGFKTQINASERTIPVFLSHGRSDLSEDRYGATGKIGRVSDASLETRDGDTLLTATLEIADPDDLAEEGDTGDIEATLRWVRQQLRLGLGATSVGWDEEPGDRDIPGDAELYEVSLVGLASDSAAQQTASRPTEAAVRGFQDLPSRQRRPSTPEGWGMRALEDKQPADEERAEEALDALEHLREHHTQDDDVPHYKRRDETPPVLATIDELRRLWGHDRDTVTVEERLEELAEDERQREDVLARLDTIDEYAKKLAQPVTSGDYQRTVHVYPFGRSGAESVERIEEAVETLRDLLTEDPDIPPMGGFAGAAEAREGDR
jgi:hypothetical protein